MKIITKKEYAKATRLDKLKMPGPATSAPRNAKKNLQLIQYQVTAPNL